MFECERIRFIGWLQGTQWAAATAVTSTSTTAAAAVVDWHRYSCGTWKFIVIFQFEMNNFFFCWKYRTYVVGDAKLSELLMQQRLSIHRIETILFLYMTLPLFNMPNYAIYCVHCNRICVVVRFIAVTTFVSMLVWWVLLTNFMLSHWYLHMDFHPKTYSNSWNSNGRHFLLIKCIHTNTNKQ